MLKKAIALSSLAVLVAVVLAACEEGAPTPKISPAPTTAIAPSTAPGGGEVQVEEVLMADTGRDYRYKPKDSFTFKVGQKVRLVLTAEAEFHTFTVDDLTTAEGQTVDVQVLPGQTVTYEFTPTNTGTFNLICIPHQINGMIGTITVEN